MAYYFDEVLYVSDKLNQLKNTGAKDPVTGDFYTETGLYRAFAKAGMTPQEHYERHGRFEGLNPSIYFDEGEYLNRKLWQLQSTEPQNNWTLEKLNAALEAAHLSPVEHYERHGCYETDAEGNFISTSIYYNSWYYFDKVSQCRESGGTVNGKTGNAINLDDVVNAFKAAGLSPISHYVQHGGAEGLQLNLMIAYRSDASLPNDWGTVASPDQNTIPPSDSDAAVKLVGIDLAENEYGALPSDDFSGA